MSTKIPLALQIATLPTVSNMNIETSILDPTTISRNGCKFVLERKGILDTGSCIQLGVVSDVPTAAEGERPFFPLRTGVHACIDSATLRIGSRIIATSDGYGRYATMTRQFKTIEERQYKDVSTKLTNDGLEPDNLGTGLYQPSGVVWSTNTEGLTPETTKIFGVDDEDETPLGVIKLSELFPMTSSLQLPLFAINEPVVIDLVFTQQGKTADDAGNLCLWDPANLPAGGDYGAKVAPTTVKFLADYLTYSSDVMNDVAKQIMSESGLSIPYDDLLLTTTTIPAAPVGKQLVARDIGMSNMNVKSLVWADQRHVSATKPLVSPLMGKYYSSATYLPSPYNVRVNDRNIYNRDVERESQQQNQLAQVFGVDLNVANCEYSWDQSVSKGGAESEGVAGIIANHRMAATSTVNGVDIRQDVGDAATPNQNFEGMQHYGGVSLITDPQTNTGTKVGQKPISLTRSINRVNNGTTATGNDVWLRKSFIWGKYQRTMVLRNGNVAVSS